VEQISQKKLPNKNVASPFSTGGGGGNFERQVGGYYLAGLLLGSVPRGLSNGVIKELRFQRLYEGEPLDDLIVTAETGDTKLRLALQIKRDLAFGEKDATFDEVIAACWRTFSASEFNRGGDRFGICLSLYSKNVDEHFQTALSWARNSATAHDFFTRIAVKKLASDKQRNFVALIRGKINDYIGQKVDDEDLWHFLKSFVILRFDFHAAGSADYAHIVELLKTTVENGSSGGASSLFDKLSNKYAAELNQTAGSIDGNALRQKLTAEDGFSLNAAPNYLDDLERLNEHASFILNEIKTDIGGVELNRDPLVNQVSQMLADCDCLQLTGPPGVGKSAILKQFALNQQGQGATLVFAGNRISGTGWNSFAHDIGLSNRLTDLLTATATSSQPVIFIDSPDRIADVGSRQIIKDLLNGLQKIQKEQKELKKWKLVITTREENLSEFYSWFDLQKLGTVKTFSVPELENDEIEFVAENFPRLKPLLLVGNLEPVLRTPFILNLLADARVLPFAETKMPPVATEFEVQKIWWDRVVGSEYGDGGSGTIAGRSRQLEMLKVGERAIAAPGKPIILNDFNAAALLSLEKDRVLIRDSNTEMHRFSHDLLEDWVLTRILNQHQNAIASYVENLGQPFGLIRPMQLLGCSILESDEPSDKWESVIRQFEKNANLSPRWRQALYSSPLTSTHAFGLLSKVKNVLFADDGRLLRELLIIILTIEITPDLGMLPYVEKSERGQNNSIPSILYQFPIPRWLIWTPLIKWLIVNEAEIPEAARDEIVKAFEIWQGRTPPKFAFRREIGEIAFSWLAKVERWRDDE